MDIYKYIDLSLKIDYKKFMSKLIKKIGIKANKKINSVQWKKSYIGKEDSSLKEGIIYIPIGPGVPWYMSIIIAIVVFILSEILFRIIGAIVMAVTKRTHTEKLPNPNVQYKNNIKKFFLFKPNAEKEFKKYIKNLGDRFLDIAIKNAKLIIPEPLNEDRDVIEYMIVLYLTYTLSNSLHILLTKEKKKLEQVLKIYCNDEQYNEAINAIKNLYNEFTQMVKELLTIINDKDFHKYVIKPNIDEWKKNNVNIVKEELLNDIRLIMSKLAKISRK